jgi:sugar phosphate isomerase/epimerase
VRVGVFLDGLAERPLADALDWLAGAVPDIRDVELGVGGYSPVPHLDLDRLLADAAARDELLGALAGRGLRLCALNASGNPLHPDPAVAAGHDRALRGAVELAPLLGVDVVVAMSGCPGAGPEDRTAPHFVAGGWLPDLEGILEWQWAERVRPYWRALAADAAQAAPDLRICFELHPGTCVYNATTFEWIASEGANLAVNLDPSHFFWQGIDPLAVVDRLGGAIGFAHGKDTVQIPANRGLDGLLDCRWPGVAAEMPWNFATVGHGQDADWWAQFVARLRAAGYDGVISIEWEDPFLASEPSIVESAAALRAAIGAPA